MKRLIPIRGVCARYDCSDRTVDRWVEAGELPEPVYIRRRRYWNEEQLNERDAARKTEAA
jgi:hypothetical protein